MAEHLRKSDIRTSWTPGRIDGGRFCSNGKLNGWYSRGDDLVAELEETPSYLIRHAEDYPLLIWRNRLCPDGWGGHEHLAVVDADGYVYVKRAAPPDLAVQTMLALYGKACVPPERTFPLLIRTRRQLSTTTWRSEETPAAEPDLVAIIDADGGLWYRITQVCLPKAKG